jgi:spatacsin
LVEAKDVGLIADVVSILPDPVLVPRYVEYLIRENKLDYLARNEPIGRAIMSVARHVRPFDPKAYFDLTLRYNFYRDHAELQLEFATMLALQLAYPAARKHFLLALSYFLHEKCYLLSLECLKKFAVVSLPYDPKLPILGLDQPTVMQLIRTRDFNFALTMALCYDMDNDKTWADAIYHQVIGTNVDVFLKAFIKVKPVTLGLIDEMVARFKAVTAGRKRRQAMRVFVTEIPNRFHRYKLAKRLNFIDLVEKMRIENPVVCEWCDELFPDEDF